MLRLLQPEPLGMAWIYHRSDRWVQKLALVQLQRVPLEREGSREVLPTI